MTRRAAIVSATIAAADAAMQTGAAMEVRLPNGLVIAAFPAVHRPRPVDGPRERPTIDSTATLVVDGVENWTDETG
jgi:hypothetical protein